MPHTVYKLPKLSSVLELHPVTGVPLEEPRGITWDLWGDELSHEQTIQRLVRAHFPLWRINPDTHQPESPLLLMFAIVEGESGEYKQAWHINVVRNGDGTIVRYDATGQLHTGVGPEFMRVKSIDLGAFQISVALNLILVEMEQGAVADFVQAQFNARPTLAIPQDSADLALQLWLTRGYKPWYAYQPGTPKWYGKLKEAEIGLTRWTIHSFLGKDPTTGKLPELIWKT